MVGNNPFYAAIFVPGLSMKNSKSYMCPRFSLNSRRCVCVGGVCGGGVCVGGLRGGVCVCVFKIDVLIGCFIYTVDGKSAILFVIP